MKREVDALIFGGGISGLVSANLLLAAGKKVVIVDPRFVIDAEKSIYKSYKRHQIIMLNSGEYRSEFNFLTVYKAVGSTPGKMLLDSGILNEEQWKVLCENHKQGLFKTGEVSEEDHGVCLQIKDIERALMAALLQRASISPGQLFFSNRETVIDFAAFHEHRQLKFNSTDRTSALVGAECFTVNGIYQPGPEYEIVAEARISPKVINLSFGTLPELTPMAELNTVVNMADTSAVVKNQLIAIFNAHGLGLSVHKRDVQPLQPKRRSSYYRIKQSAEFKASPLSVMAQYTASGDYSDRELQTVFQKYPTPPWAPFNLKLSGNPFSVEVAEGEFVKVFVDTIADIDFYDVYKETYSEFKPVEYHGRRATFEIEATLTATDVKKRILSNSVLVLPMGDAWRTVDHVTGLGANFAIIHGIELTRGAIKAHLDGDAKAVASEFIAFDKKVKQLVKGHDTRVTNTTKREFIRRCTEIAGFLVAPNSFGHFREITFAQRTFLYHVMLLLKNGAYYHANKPDYIAHNLCAAFHGDRLNADNFARFFDAAIKPLLTSGVSAVSAAPSAGKKGAARNMKPKMAAQTAPSNRQKLGDKLDACVALWLPREYLGSGEIRAIHGGFFADFITVLSSDELPDDYRNTLLRVITLVETYDHSIEDVIRTMVQKFKEVITDMPSSRELMSLMQLVDTKLTEYVTVPLIDDEDADALTRVDPLCEIGGDSAARSCAVSAMTEVGLFDKPGAVAGLDIKQKQSAQHSGADSYSV